jgi:hypothetical protein
MPPDTIKLQVDGILKAFAVEDVYERGIYQGPERDPGA